MSERLVVGCMTGTSIDGIDAALVRIDGTGLDMSAEVVRWHSRELGDLAAGLRLCAEQEPLPASNLARMARRFAVLHAELIRDLCGESTPDLVAIHGQTVFHRPPVSWQLMDLPHVAYSLGCDVVGDLRAADLAAGGEGAPITPLADWVLFRGYGERRAIINLGGFCNVTLLPGDADPESVRGGDVCACNHVLDMVARRCLNQPYDHEGQQAALGSDHPAARDELEGTLRAQAQAGRSLGTSDECSVWVERWHEQLRPRDLARSACSALGQVIGEAVYGCDRILVAGGGAKHRTLLRAIARVAGVPTDLTDVHRVPHQQREAAAMAVLGALSQDRVPITLRAITGAAQSAVAGTWVFGGPPQRD
ncbi:MAG: anhydro-N-acetylmuramic acid kinase [Planctomycetota bacterium]|jgi:anhydro-N-acetylmuramic acid kinase|nr:anhydro-N-acetylmuramic acid kinase [Planctomycetota bacterium]